jgi:hypothetical protein
MVQESPIALVHLSQKGLRRGEAQSQSEAHHHNTTVRGMPPGHGSQRVAGID